MDITQAPRDDRNFIKVTITKKKEDDAELNKMYRLGALKYYKK